MKNCEKLCASKRPVELSDSSSDFQPSPAKRKSSKALNRSLPVQRKKNSPITKTTSASTSLQPEYKSPTHIDNLKNSINPNTPPKSPALSRKDPAIPKKNNFVSTEQEHGPKSKPVDDSYEAQTETDKFKSIPIRAKLLTDLPPNEVDRYPNHTHYMLFISIPKFSDREFFYELMTKVPNSDHWINICWGDGTRHQQRKYRSSKKEPVPFVDDENMVQQTFSYYFREGHFERMRVRIHFNGEVREVEAQV